MRGAGHSPPHLPQEGREEQSGGGGAASPPPALPQGCRPVDLSYSELQCSGASDTLGFGALKLQVFKAPELCSVLPSLLWSFDQNIGDSTSMFWSFQGLLCSILPADFWTFGASLRLVCLAELEQGSRRVSSPDLTLPAQLDRRFLLGYPLVLFLSLYLLML